MHTHDKVCDLARDAQRESEMARELARYVTQLGVVLIFHNYRNKLP